MPQISPFRFAVAPVGALALTVALMAAPPLLPAAAQGSGTTLAPAASQQLPGFRVDAGKRVTADGTFPVADALSRLLKGSGESFILSAAAVGEVTLSLKDVPFETALKLILNASQMPLTYGREDGVYVITRRGPATEAAAPAGATSPAAATPSVVSVTTPDANSAIITALTLRIAEADAELAARRVDQSQDHPQVKQTLARLESLRGSLTEMERRAVEIGAGSGDRQALLKYREQLIYEKASLLNRGYLPAAGPVKKVDIQLKQVEETLRAQKAVR
jgi:hypothetical protein